MQLKLTIKGNRIRLPIASAHTIQGFIYHALCQDETFSGRLHEVGYAAGSRKFKLFTFGELRGRYEIEGKEIIYPETVFLEIRSTDAYMLQLLYTHFIRHPKKRLGKNEIEIAHAALEDTIVFSDAITIKTASPIVVYQTMPDGHTTYFSPEDAEFYDAVVENAKRKWASYTKSDIVPSFSVTPQKNARFVKRATKFKETLITAWHGEFCLEGTPQMLNFLYHTGLGSKNSQGFGMFDVL